MGIAIILKDQDFTGSALGHVTFKKSISEKAADYLAAYKTVIGTSDYDDALTEMYISLISEGLDEKVLGLWPMLGNTLNSLKANALNPGTFDLCLGANANAGNNKIDFVQSIGVGNMLSSATFLNNVQSFVQISVAQSTSSQVQNQGHYCFQTNVQSGGLDATGFSIGTVSLESLRQWVITPHTGNLNLIHTQVTQDDIIKFYMYMNSTSVTASFNDNTPVTQEYDFSERLINPNNTLGFKIYQSENSGESGAETTTSEQKSVLFGGSSYFHIVGDMNATEFNKLKQIVNTFLLTAKGI